MDDETAVVYVNVARTSKGQRIYIGCSNDRERRLKEHNNKKSPSTKSTAKLAGLWLPLFSIKFASKTLALQAEHALKKVATPKSLKKSSAACRMAARINNLLSRKNAARFSKKSPPIAESPAIIYWTPAAEPFFSHHAWPAQVTHSRLLPRPPPLAESA